MSAIKDYHLKRLRQIRDEMYARLPPESQRRINEARQARLDWQSWRRKQPKLLENRRNLVCPSFFPPYQSSDSR